MIKALCFRKRPEKTKNPRFRVVSYRISLSLADVTFLAVEDHIVKVEDHELVRHIFYHTPFSRFYTLSIPGFHSARKP